MASGGKTPGLPAKLEPGEELAVGQARLERSSNGVLEACDPYGCSRLNVRPSVEVRVLPAPASRRLLQVTHVYVEFESPIHARDGDVVWFHAPIELEVVVDGIPALRLAPIPVKYTLVGDVVDGIVCRYYKSPARLETPPGEHPPGTALAALRVIGDPAILPGGGVGVYASRLYRDGEGTLYYSLQRLEVEGVNATLRPTQNPPLEGVREVRRPMRRVPRLQQALQLLVIRLPHLEVE
jgi:hypothetical protein